MRLTRRGLLAAVAGSAGAAALAGCGGTPPAPQRPADGTRQVRYGSGPDRHAELLRPPGGTTRLDLTVVLVHGGYWQAAYTAELMRPLASALSRLGATTWNLEYRRVGEGGGFPATLEDVAAGVDALADQDVPRPTVLLGHSAGGHLAAWAASRTAATPGGAPRVRPTRVVSLSGVLDLAAAADQTASSAPVRSLMDGGPEEHPEQYAVADPAALVPAGCPVLVVQAEGERVIDPRQGPAYVAAARAAGGDARLVEVPGDHFTLIDPDAEAFATTSRLVLGEGTTR